MFDSSVGEGVLSFTGEGGGVVGGETSESFETCVSLSLGIMSFYLSSVFEDDFALISLLTVFDSSVGKGVVLSTGEGEGMVWGEISESFQNCVSLSLGITSLSVVEDKRDVTVVLIPCATIPAMLCFMNGLKELILVFNGSMLSMTSSFRFTIFQISF